MAGVLHADAAAARGRIFAAIAVACAVTLGSLGLVAATPAAAQAAVAYSYPTAGATGVPTNGTFYFYFQNNVAADDVFAGNAGHVYLADENGVAAAFSVYRLFSGNTPQDCPAGVDPEQRHFIYVDAGGLAPGTVYTLGVSPGVATQGGGVEGGYAITFTTAGNKPEPDPPEPDVPEPPDGGGGSGGQGGSDAAGSGADQGGASGAGTMSGASAESVAEAEAAPAAEDAVLETAVQTGQSRAAGSGGGAVYVIGASGLDAGRAAEPSSAEEPMPSRLPTLALCLLAAGLALAGAARRTVSWRRHTVR